MTDKKITDIDNLTATISDFIYNSDYTFKDVDEMTISVINKKIGKFVNKIRENDFRLSINMKVIHGTEMSEKYELSCNFKAFKHTKPLSIKVVERDLIKGINMLLGKVENSFK